PDDPIDVEVEEARLGVAPRPHRPGPARVLPGGEGERAGDELRRLDVEAAPQMRHVPARREEATETLRFERGHGHPLPVDRIERAERLSYEKKASGKWIHFLPMPQSILGMSISMNRAYRLGVPDQVVEERAHQAFGKCQIARFVR